MNAIKFSTRSRVLNLYRRILRVAKSWEAASHQVKDTGEERQYIKTEARHLFRKNSQITSPTEVEASILEGEARMEMGLHYRNPYPRISNMPPFSMTKGKGREQSEMTRKRTLPLYLRSYENDSGPK
ncbi:hypothetical protein RvY_03531-1 [Ramazzottius varieornatus]|uniref:Complex 1 LYR protein domain-containing protein n=1 Tax=Ramazzottius varieornatus TaxID=947166 RepID=A0A1D1UP67_RAMVA|nr:hypothetical protein RvY_03531-1 [Ramazzottius varieornatus]